MGVHVGWGRGCRLSARAPLGTNWRNSLESSLGGITNTPVFSDRSEAVLRLF